MRFAWSGEIRPDHPALAGHFPGNPVVPGALLLNATLRAVELGWGQSLRIVAAPAVKFSSILRPGEKFDIHVETSGEDLIKFSITRGTTLIATGRLRYKKMSLNREQS